MDFQLKTLNIDIQVTRIANLHYFEFTKQYNSFKDRHPFKELVYVDSGVINIESELYSGKLSDGQIIIHKNNELHSLSTDDNSPQVIIIGFECDTDRLDSFSERTYTLSPDQKAVLSDIVKVGRDVFLPPYDVPNQTDMKKRPNQKFGSEQLLKSKLEMFLIELIQDLDAPVPKLILEKPDKKTENIYTYIIDHYNEKITLDDLCFLFTTNKTTICNNFKNSYGDTIVDFINKIRIKHAKKLLRQGEMNLTEVSNRVGFSSIHYFCRIFKVVENQTPTQYIKTIKSRLENNFTSN